MTDTEAPPRFSQLRRVVFGIGAQKAGTTWLHRHFAAHPDIHVNRRKELHYWETIRPPRIDHYLRESEADRARLRRQLPVRRVIRRGLAAHRDALRRAELYHRMLRVPDPAHADYQAFMMDGWQGEPVAAELSPGYALLSADTFAEMDRIAPDARFVFLLRDPVDRLWSNTLHNIARKMGDPPDGETAEQRFLRMLADEDAPPFARSDYRRTLAALDDAGLADRCAVHFYETIFDQAEINRLEDFLGLSRTRANLSRRVNSARMAADLSDQARSKARDALAATYDDVRRRFGQAVPDSWL